jgi:peptidoglycan/LPS O-acetylase OafA/YrhL
MSNPNVAGATITASSSRNAGLDALRAFACAMVVVFHLQLDTHLDFGALNPFVAGGNVGIYVFFTLSGYLLYRPFVRRPVELGGYAIKRAARILPGYYVALVALVILTGTSVPWHAPLEYLTLSASYSPPLRVFMGSAWTLSAELLFYVSLPFIARLADRRELPILIGLSVASILAAIVFAVSVSSSTEWLTGTYPFMFYAFAPGMLLAVIERTQPAAFARLASWPVLALGAVLLAWGTLEHAAIIGYGPTIGAALLMGWLLQHRVPGATLLAFLGGMSYALYLWHRDIFIAFGTIGLPIALVGAAASWMLVERPILAWAHRVTRRRAARSVPDGAASATAA